MVVLILDQRLPPPPPLTQPPKMARNLSKATSYMVSVMNAIIACPYHSCLGWRVDKDEACTRL